MSKVYYVWRYCFGCKRQSRFVGSVNVIFDGMGWLECVACKERRERDNK